MNDLVNERIERRNFFSYDPATDFPMKMTIHCDFRGRGYPGGGLQGTSLSNNLGSAGAGGFLGGRGGSSPARGGFGFFGLPVPPAYKAPKRVPDTRSLLPLMRPGTPGLTPAGAAKFLRWHPAARYLNLALDFYHMAQEAQEAGWDLEGGEVLCDIGGTKNAWKTSQVPTTTELCGVGGQTMPDQNNGTIGALLDGGTVYLGFSTHHPTIKRMSILEQIRFPEGQTWGPWPLKPATGPTFQPGGNPGPQPAPYFLLPYRRGPMLEQGNGPPTPPRVPRPPLPSPPPPYTKEKKKTGTGWNGLHAVWSAATETGDWVDAFFNALPAKTRNGCGGSKASIDQKASCVLNNLGEVDPWKALAGVIYNLGEDAFFGRINAALQSVGIGVGFNGVPYVLK